MRPKESLFSASNKQPDNKPKRTAQTALDEEDNPQKGHRLKLHRSSTFNRLRKGRGCITASEVALVFIIILSD